MLTRAGERVRRRSVGAEHDRCKFRQANCWNHYGRFEHVVTERAAQSADPTASMSMFWNLQN